MRTTPLRRDSQLRRNPGQVTWKFAVRCVRICGAHWFEDMKNLEHEFDEAMINLYRSAKEECDYNATYFLRMLNDHGSIETAHRLLSGKEPQSGFTRLWECERLDITVECLVLNPKFQELFEDHELETARRRLRQYDSDPERCEQDSRRTGEE